MPSREKVQKFSNVPRRRLPGSHYFATRLPARLHKAAKLHAISLDVPLGTVLIEALEEYLVARRKLP
jgi:hypothetical protein